MSFMAAEVYRSTHIRIRERVDRLADELREKIALHYERELASRPDKRTALRYTRIAMDNIYLGPMFQECRDGVLSDVGLKYGQRMYFADNDRLVWDTGVRRADLDFGRESVRLLEDASQRYTVSVRKSFMGIEHGVSMLGFFRGLGRIKYVGVSPYAPVNWDSWYGYAGTTSMSHGSKKSVELISSKDTTLMVCSPAEMVYDDGMPRMFDRLAEGVCGVEVSERPDAGAESEFSRIRKVHPSGILEELLGV